MPLTRIGTDSPRVSLRGKLDYLEDREDSELAEEASRDIGRTYSLEEVIREYGLEDKVRSQSEEAARQA